MDRYDDTARRGDQADELAGFRSRFHFPKGPDGTPVAYFVGNSLGLQPVTAPEYVREVLEDWARLGVEGHFKARHPWFPYHESVTAPMARVVGALPGEVVVMNSLTTNLHLLMVSFYRPTSERYRILMLGDGFPSDRYAVRSQAAFHGFDPSDAVVGLVPRPGESFLREADILEAIARLGDSLALVLWENVHYATGQAFPLAEMARAAHRVGARFGVDLAHGAGNLKLCLHDDDVDFAAWCTYKYLNSGPGSVAGCFVHERHGGSRELPRFAGWWGHDKKVRFQMGEDFSPISGAEGWQLSNPPILPLAALRASLEIFDDAGMDRLRAKSERLTGFLEQGLEALPEGFCEILTPRVPTQRGAQLSVKLKGADRSWVEKFRSRGIVLDYREPGIFRLAPAPLYTSFGDVARLLGVLREAAQGDW